MIGQCSDCGGPILVTGTAHTPDCPQQKPLVIPAPAAPAPLDTTAQELRHLKSVVRQLAHALENATYGVGAVQAERPQDYFKQQAKVYLADRTIWPFGSSQKLHPAVEGFAEWLDAVGVHP